MKKKLVLYWKSLSILAIICYLSFASPSNFSNIPSFNGIDKVVHLLMYLGLNIVLTYDYRKDQRIRDTNKWFWLICVVSPIVIGGMVEIIQPRFFAPRTGSWGDWVADIAGVLIGMGITYIVNKTILASSNKQ